MRCCFIVPSKGGRCGCTASQLSVESLLPARCPRPRSLRTDDEHEKEEDDLNSEDSTNKGAQQPRALSELR